MFFAIVLLAKRGTINKGGTIMSRKRETVFMGIGILTGLALCGPASAAVQQLTAAPTSQTFYVDGQRVQFEAYEIHGNNFVKLRDIGKAVDFGVTYDGATNTVHIAPDSPYIEEVTTPAPATPTPFATPEPTITGGYTIAADHWSREDFSQRANPSVFTGVYDRDLYNTIKQTLVDGGPGTAPAYTMVDKQNYGEVKRLLGRMDNTRWLEHYVPDNFTNYWQYLGYFAVSAKEPEQYQAARSFIQPAITQANQLGSDREKVEYLHDYLCSLMAYDLGFVTDIARVFSPHSNELKGACGDYARAFNYLCGAASIPSFTIRSADHSWNMVYADGRWLQVDVSADDLHGNKNALLVETYPRHTDIAPQATAFLKELLVPGSTK